MHAYCQVCKLLVIAYAYHWHARSSSLYIHNWSTQLTCRSTLIGCLPQIVLWYVWRYFWKPFVSSDSMSDIPYSVHYISMNFHALECICIGIPFYPVLQLMNILDRVLYYNRWTEIFYLKQDIFLAAILAFSLFPFIIILSFFSYPSDKNQTILQTGYSHPRDTCAASAHTLLLCQAWGHRQELELL